MSAENAEQIPKSLELARLLENTDDEEVLRENLGAFLQSLEADLRIEFLDAGSIYADMEEQRCLARVETLSRVLETVELRVPLQVGDRSERHYANAVLPTGPGIKIAFAEGQAPGPIRTMVGFGKTIIGFKTDHLTVDEIDFDPDDIRGAQERKYLCRHVSGELLPEDVRSVVMRIPRHLIKEEFLKEEEKESKSPFIFKAFKLGN